MSNFGKKLRSTATAYIPTTIGEPYGGGYYAGRMRFGGVVWLVVLAPMSPAANSSIMFASTASTKPTGLTTYDGNLNHQLCVADGISKYPAAQWCANLNIGGFTDWHVPAQYELDICYRAFRPANVPNTSYGANTYAEPPKGNYTSSDPAATTLPLFVSGGAQAFEPNFHLTSTESGSGVIVMNFNGGSTATSATNANRYLRPTRLVRTSLP